MEILDLKRVKKYERSLREMCAYTIKHTNTLMGIPEEETKGQKNL